MKNSNRKFFSVFDLIIIFIVIMISAFSLLSQIAVPQDNKQCVIRVGGEEVYRISLSDVKDNVTYSVDGDLPVEVTVTANGAFVKSSKCPDKLCEHSGKISRVGQSIVCLPGKVSVTLVGDDENSLDAVVG